MKALVYAFRSFGRELRSGEVLVLLSAPANAFYCPNQGKAIDHALTKVWKANGPQLNGAERAAVENLRDQGMALHGSGDHTGAVKALAGATRIILNGL